MGSVTEQVFRQRYILSLPGAQVDWHGNIHVPIGQSTILWSAHTDTVHRKPGRQAVEIHKGQLRLTAQSARLSSCLGADDTVGCFILRRMILAQVPGHYVFHYGEERGGIGSHALAEDPSWDFRAFTHAIAFDRAGTSDVITHQAGGRCASTRFAQACADLLNAQDPHFAYAPSARGIYTDTAEYTEQIPECTNISVGYTHAHTPDESVDIAHVFRLTHAMIAIGRQCADLPCPGPDDDREADRLESLARAARIKHLASARLTESDYIFDEDTGELIEVDVVRDCSGDYGDPYEDLPDERDAPHWRDLVRDFYLRHSH